LINKKRNCPDWFPEINALALNWLVKLARTNGWNVDAHSGGELPHRGDVVIFDPSFVINLTGLARY